MMEMEDKESTESGSLGGNSEYDSPPQHHHPPPPSQSTNGVVTHVMNMNMNMNMNMERSVEGGVMGSGGTGVVEGSGGGRVNGVGGVVVMGSGEKKKRGRPRKYDAEGNLTPQYIKATAAAAAAKAAAAAAAAAAGVSPPGVGSTAGVTSPPGFTITSQPSSSKRGRGRPVDSPNLQLISSLGEIFAHTAGGDFMPHVVTVQTGEDVAGKVYSFLQKGSRGICVLSANGAVSNVTIRQPGSSGGLLTYEGRFEILALTGSYTVSESAGMRTRSGGLSVSLAGPDGRVVGGGIAGSLIAASPIQMVVGSFMPNAFKTQNKRKYQQVEARSAAPVIHGSPDPVSMVRPISHAPPSMNNMTMTQAPHISMQIQGEADSNKDMPNSTSTDNSECNGSDQRPYPDINVSIPME